MSLQKQTDRTQWFCYFSYFIGSLCYIFTVLLVGTGGLFSEGVGPSHSEKSSVRFFTVTICRSPRQASHFTLPPCITIKCKRADNFLKTLLLKLNYVIVYCWSISTEILLRSLVGIATLTKQYQFAPDILIVWVYWYISLIPVICQQ